MICHQADGHARETRNVGIISPGNMSGLCERRSLTFRQCYATLTVYTVHVYDRFSTLITTERAEHAWSHQRRIGNRIARYQTIYLQFLCVEPLESACHCKTRYLIGGLCSLADRDKLNHLHELASIFIARCRLNTYFVSDSHHTNMVEPGKGGSKHSITL